jgi:hypothetical protein
VKFQCGCGSKNRTVNRFAEERIWLACLFAAQFRMGNGLKPCSTQNLSSLGQCALIYQNHAACLSCPSNSAPTLLISRRISAFSSL